MKNPGKLSIAFFSVFQFKALSKADISPTTVANIVVVPD